MITKLHVQNFKCLRDVSVDLEPFTVLIGKNDTGKTSFLEAVEALSGLVQEKPRQLAVNRFVWHGADPRSIGWSAEVAATARTRLPASATYKLRVSPSAKVRDGVYVDEESLAITGTPVYAGYSRRDTLVLKEPPVVIQRNLEGLQTAVSVAWSEQGFTIVNDFARAITTSPIYRLEPERLAEPAAYDIEPTEPEQVPALSSDGHGLPLLLDYILGTDRAAFEQIERDLATLAPYVRAIRIKPHRFGNAPGPARVGKSLSFELRSGGEISASLASQGLLLFLAYLTLTHAVGAPAIILIEEPENGVHPRQLQRIAEYLKRLTDPARGATAVQLVVATHSPYFLDFVDPKSVRVFGRKPSGETVVAPLLDLPGVKKRLASGFSLGEMWFNVGEDKLLAEVLQ
jgi:predicted ATPase